jgi:hypothetical protein
MANKPGLTPLGRAVIVIFILALIGGAGYFLRDYIFPKAANKTGQVDMSKFKGQAEGAEAQDPTGITTVANYSYVPAQKLPPVKGASAYKWDPAAKVVKFPINVWIGWLPIVAANHGFAPNAESIF